MVGSDDGTDEGIPDGSYDGSDDGTIEGNMLGVLLASKEGPLDGYNGHASSLYISPYSPVAPLNPSIT